ncbi:MAG: trans-sulfuration enzyme family protein [Bacteroidia bacterium]
MKRRITRLIHPDTKNPKPDGAVKMPVYASSTYRFESAEAGAATFAWQQGREVLHPPAPYNYARLGHPNLDTVEAQLLAVENREPGAWDALAFESGMAAITTTLLALLKPGAVLVTTTPLYGGTRQFIRDFLEPWGIRTWGLEPSHTAEQVLEAMNGVVPSVLYVETPANPTNQIWDWDYLGNLKKTWAASGSRVLMIADNTYWGPCWQNPLDLGADLTLYSATKSMSGHSDLVCGACIGETSLIKVIRSWRNKLGNTASPFTSWLLSRSLETVTLRMQASQQNAQILAPLLARHPAVERLVYPGAGSMLSLWLQGPDNPKKAWAFLNQLKIIQLAVSLGSNESLACHPASTTHSGVDPKERHQHGIDERLIRLSIGIEDPEDLWEDLEAALEASMNV